MGEQNYSELKHSRSVNNSVLGRKTPSSFNSSFEGFDIYLSQTRYLLQNGAVQYEEEIASFCGIGPIGQKKMLSADRPVPFSFSPLYINFPH